MNMKQMSAALAIIQDSERLIVNLRVSIDSFSSEKNLIESGLVPYLRSKKRGLMLKMFFVTLRACWLKVARVNRSDY